MPSIVLGSGAYTYEPVEDWGELPEGWRYVLTLPIYEFDLCSCGFLVHPL